MMRRVDEINALARELHGSDAAASVYTFGSLAEHVDEVRELLEAKDVHWKAETLDIIIHGLILLRRGGVDEKEYEELLNKRLSRFKEKISAANAKNRE
jgi:hypothetical protein